MIWPHYGLGLHWRCILCDSIIYPTYIYERFRFEKEIYIGPNAKPFFDFLKCMVVNHFLNVRSLEARYRHQILIFCLANAMIII